MKNIWVKSRKDEMMIRSRRLAWRLAGVNFKELDENKKREEREQWLFNVIFSKNFDSIIQKETQQGSCPVAKMLLQIQRRNSIKDNTGDKRSHTRNLRSKKTMNKLTFVPSFVLVFVHLIPMNLFCPSLWQMHGFDVGLPAVGPPQTEPPHMASLHAPQTGGPCTPLSYLHDHELHDPHSNLSSHVTGTTSEMSSPCTSEWTTE